MNKLMLMLSLAVLFFVGNAATSNRMKVDFNKSWRFSLGDNVKAADVTFDDSGWRLLNLPHDWSIEGTFSKDNPATVGGGALPGGIGWYRKDFLLDKIYEGKHLFVEFDGVYMNSEVWINGHYLGKRPNGYISFSYDITPYIKIGKEKNIIAVKVDNSQQPNSRWYSGSGIYRNVRLVAVNPVYVAQWGTQVTASKITASSSTVHVSTTIANRYKAGNGVTLKTSIVDAAGKVVSVTESKVEVNAEDESVTNQELVVSTPHLWSVDSPYLYKVISEIYLARKKVDEYATPLGIRTIEFDVDKGFLLNGKHMKINGVCLHHDLGCLGSAMNRYALERQLKILKEMGCNGIRTSHNPPAPELLQLCDSLGFIVMDEAFDMWKKQKNPHDYHLSWDEWHKRDLVDQLKRDRNHPSVMIWSIGNEIPEQWDEAAGAEIAKELVKIVKEYDTTRPITAACNEINPKNGIINSGVLDLIGYNYNHPKFKNFHTDYPGKKFIATETVSALQTRGHYDMPSDSLRIWPERWDLPFEKGNKDLTCSAYENCRTPWGSTHEDTWKILKSNDFLSGGFIWTGFDYLGEPTPYVWPARSSYFGIVDLAGFPKDVYYMYQSEWTSKDVLHLFPHWNWNAGQIVDIWAYYNNADEVELFVNGKSQGIRSKKNDDLHVMWRVGYEPGELKAVSRKNGEVVKTVITKTAGQPAKVVLTADKIQLKADGYDLLFVSVSIQDSEGNECPDASNMVDFKVDGEGMVVGVDNGCQTYTESLKVPHVKAFNGKCLAVIQNKGESGMFKVTASSSGLISGFLEVKVR